MYVTWQAPTPEGASSEEIAVAFDRKRDNRLLVLAPLFDEHNKTRHQIVEIMRRLDLRGIDSILPDLPGCNESIAAIDHQSISAWRSAIAAARDHFKPTHFLAIRGGCLLLPSDTLTYAYAPAKGAALLNAMLRARVVASKEAGEEEKRPKLLELGRTNGLDLAGWRLGAQMIRELEAAEPNLPGNARLIEQSEIGGSPLWLRAEPDDDPEQADALAALLAIGLLGE